MNRTIITSKGAPPSSVSFSLDDLNHEDDDRSELTGPSYGGDLSQEDDFRIKLAADPYYYHTLDISHLDLKLQIARQQEKLDMLSSKLSQCEVENEALKAEKAFLVDELALEVKEKSTTRRGWFSKGSNGNDGLMQLLVDTNAKLVTDNARLQVVADVMRKSFQSFIRDSQRGSGKHKQIIKTLQQENKRQQRLSASENFRLSCSERTAKTSLGSSFTEKNQEDLPVDSSRHSTQDNMLRNSLHSIPELEFKFGTSGDDWVIGGEVIEETNNGLISERAARGIPWSPYGAKKP